MAIPPAQKSATKLSGMNPLAYMGVNASSPSQLRIQKTSPTTADTQNFTIGDEWIVSQDKTGVYQYWKLLGLSQGVANWANLYPGGSSGGLNVICNSGGASPITGTLNIKGDTVNVTTTGASNTVTISLEPDVVISGSLAVTPLASGVIITDSTGNMSAVQGTDLQMLIGATGLAPSFLTPVSQDDSVTIALGTAPGTINFQAIGGGSGNFGGLKGDMGTATPLSNTVTVAGGVNMNTIAALHTLTVNLDDSISLPATTADGTEGVISIDSNPFISALGTRNTFLGSQSGNLTLTTLSCTDNTAAGFKALNALTVSPCNTVMGSEAGSSLDGGSGQNTILGCSAANALIDGSFNTIIGFGAGQNLGGAESGNILIQAPGTSGLETTTIIGHSQSDCYIAGIDGSSSLGSHNGVVLVDNSNKLVSSLGTSGQVLTAGATGASWQTPSAATGTSYAFYVTENYATTSGVNYYLGTAEILPLAYYNSSALFPGDGLGNPAVFTAPKAGTYLISYIISTTTYNRTLTIVPSASTLYPAFIHINYNSETQDSYFTHMALGDTLQFYIYQNAGYPGGTVNYTLWGYFLGS